MTEGPGHFIAAGLRREAREEIAEGRGPWAGAIYHCRSCERPTLTLEHDGWCGQCCDGTTSATPRHGTAIRALRLTTATMLRAIGYPERAAVHEREP